MFNTPTSSFLDLILPPVCLNCHTPLSTPNSLCPPCWQGLTFISHPICQKTGAPLPFAIGPDALSAQAIAHPPIYDQARSVAHYEGTMRSLIHKLKYQDRHELTTLLATWLFHAGRPLIEKSDLIIPIPLHAHRLWQRRFNQSALLAKRLGQLTQHRVSYNTLKRRKKTRSQVGLTMKERKENLRNAFVVNHEHKQDLADTSVLLIDDVITTGETANAAAKTLKTARVSSIYILSLGQVGMNSI